MQRFLMKLAYDLAGYGADGYFGLETESAVKTSQSNKRLKVDGKYGDRTHTALMDAVADVDKDTTDSETKSGSELPETESSLRKQVRIVSRNGTVNIRMGNNTKYHRITSATDGDDFEWVATAENGWHAIVVNNRVGWVSGVFSKIIC